MIVELIAFGLLASACLAVYFDEPIYAVASTALYFLFASLLYALNGALFAAIFIIAIGAGSVSVLFLAGEMLGERGNKQGNKLSLRGILLTILVAFLLVLPPSLISISYMTSTLFPTLPFEVILWNLRAIDVLLHGLLILSIAVGIAIILYERRNGD
ncbi:MAG: hypothetical protein QXO20_01545 [Candidatus Bathyarchaeia archaeon]